MLSAQQPVVRYIGIENGLSNNAVTSIYQDHNGFMWFGTYDGLNRYDGYTFKIFRNIIGDSTSLKSNNVYTIEGDPQNDIWIGAQKGVSVYDPLTSKFSSPKFLYDGKAQPVSDDSHSIKAVKGNILIGTQHHGLLVFANKSSTGIQVSLDGKDINYDVASIEYDTSSQLVYVFIQSRGLYLYDVQQRQLQLLSNTHKAANCLKVDTKGGLWLGDDNGFYSYNSNTNTFTQNLITNNTKVVKFWLDKTGILWIVSDGSGVWSLANGASKSQPLLSANGSPLVNSNAVYAVYEDLVGRKWFGTLRGGINVIESTISPFKKIQYNVANENNLVENFILSFCEDGKNVWIGTDGAGLRYWDRKKNSFTEYVCNPANKNSISSNFITNITKDYQNDIWLSTWFGGISRFKKSTHSFERYTCFNPITHAEEKNAWLLYEDRYKRLWAGTTNDGTLYQFNRSTNMFDLFDPTIDNIQCLVEDRSGSLWGGNYTSLIKIDPVNKKHVTYPIGYPVRSIHEDVDGNFWIGTQEGGLLLFDRKTGQYKRFTTTDGLPSNTVLRLLEDSKGDIWMSTYNGLSKFDYKNKAFHNFSQSDGLQSNQFSFNAALALHSGEFLFGGIKGFNIFYPDSVTEKFEIPKIFLTGLKINNEQIEENTSYITERQSDQISKITVPYNQAVLSLDYIALAYSNTDKIKYAYFLEGWDKAWNDVGHYRTANYSRLQDGKYIFKVRVSNPDGKWSNETPVLEIIVLPPWYRSWWACSMYVVLLVGAAYLYLVYRTRQNVLKYQIKIAHIEAEKRKEIYNVQLQFFTNISHEFRTPLTLIMGPLEKLLKDNTVASLSSSYRVMYRNATRLLTLINELMDFRKVETGALKLKVMQGNLSLFLHEIADEFSEMAMEKNVNFNILIEEHFPDMLFDRQVMEKVIINLLSNSFKYTNEGGNITLEALTSLDKFKPSFENALVIKNNYQAKDYFYIRVADNGIGISKESLAHLFESYFKISSEHLGSGIGLAFVKSLTMLHKGNIQVYSERLKGTEIIVSIPKSQSDYNAEERWPEKRQEGVVQLESIHDYKYEMQQSLHEEPSASVLYVTKTADVAHILIVDDNAELRSFFKEALSPYYSISEAADGNEGLQKTKEESPDLIISDVMMPVMNGVDFCKQVKEDPATKQIPFLMLTAKSAIESHIEGTDAGADFYFSKPINIDLLLLTLRNIFSHKQTLKERYSKGKLVEAHEMAHSIKDKDFMDQLLAIIDENITDPEMSVDFISSQIGMSKTKLYEKIKTISGQSISEFVRTVRLKKALEIMTHEDVMLTEVTYRVGIQTQSYFTKAFKKEFGKTPSAFMQELKKQ